MIKTLGTFARIWGRSLDKFGQSFQGSAVYVETLVPQTQYVAHNDKSPTVSNICFVAPIHYFSSPRTRERPLALV